MLRHETVARIPQPRNHPSHRPEEVVNYENLGAPNKGRFLKLARGDVLPRVGTPKLNPFRERGKYV